jgi:hypothetical protein
MKEQIIEIIDNLADEVDREIFPPLEVMETLVINCVGAHCKDEVLLRDTILKIFFIVKVSNLFFPSEDSAFIVCNCVCSDNART